MSFKLSEAGQINEGDFVKMRYNGRMRQYKAKKVLNAGKGNEEIIINKKQNKYFITSMAIDGTSWAKDVIVTNQINADRSGK